MMRSTLAEYEDPRGIKAKLAAIARERSTIESQLADAASSRDIGRQFFTLALELLADPQAFYRRGSEQVKRAVTKLLFAKLYLGAERVERHDAPSRRIEPLSNV